MQDRYKSTGVCTRRLEVDDVLITEVTDQGTPHEAAAWTVLQVKRNVAQVARILGRWGDKPIINRTRTHWITAESVEHDLDTFTGEDFTATVLDVPWPAWWAENEQLRMERQCMGLPCRGS